MAKVIKGCGGWIFECPGCGGYHRFTDKWKFNGDTEKPTFKPSLIVNVTEGRCHSFVEDGKIRFLKDCWHSLAGKTILLEDVDW